MRCNGYTRNHRTRSRIRIGLAGASSLLLLLSGLHGPAFADGTLDDLRALGKDAAKAYLDPATSVFGAALNSGWFYGPPDPMKLDLDFDFGLINTNGLYIGAPKHFTTTGTFNFDRAQALVLVGTAFSQLIQDPRVAALSQAQRDALQDTLASRVSGPDITVTMRGPTAVGPDNDSLFINFQGQTATLTIPQAGGGSFDTTIAIAADEIAIPMQAALGKLPFLPVFSPQIGLGTFYGTRVLLRWLPRITFSDDLGGVSLWGFGIQHNLAVWFGGPSAPLDMTVDFHGQWLDVEDAFTATGYSGGLLASKTFGQDGPFGLIPFAGVGIESSKLEADYTYTVETPAGNVKRSGEFEIDGDNTWHATLGGTVRFLFINLTGDYNFANYNSFSMNLMIKI